MSTDEPTRTCYACGCTLPLSAFPTERRRKHGKSYRCKGCSYTVHVAYQTRRYRTDPAFAEAERARRRKRYAETGR